MKTLKLSKTTLPKIQNLGVGKKAKFILLAALLLGAHFSGFAQISELVSSVNEVQAGTTTIGNSFISIVRVCAAVLVAILGLTFLLMRNNNSDMASKVGQACVGVAIFYGFLEMANSLA